jgi:hypothetical protein
VIEIFKFIYGRLGPLGFWLREDLKRTIEDRVRKGTGLLPELGSEEGHACYFLPDTDEIRFWMDQAIIEGITKTGQVEPRWNSYQTKLEILKPMKLNRQQKSALKKACDLQAQPYRQRALEWLVGLEYRGNFLDDLKAQVIKWLADKDAGRKVYPNPLSEKQMVILMDRCFNENSDRPADWLAPDEKEELVEMIRFDPWTGESTTVKMAKHQVELMNLRQEYYQRNAREAASN